MFARVNAVDVIRQFDRGRGVASEYSDKDADRQRAWLNSLIVSFVDESRWPIAIVKEDLTLMWMNKAGAEECAAEKSFLIESGRLTLGQGCDDERLTGFLGQCDGKDRVFTHTSRAADPLLARCRRLADRGEESFFGISFFRPSGKPADLVPPLKRLFGLTTTEERIVAMLNDGSTADNVAEDLKVSIATVRKHISNAYRKTGVSSREELFALLRTYS